MKRVLYASLALLLAACGNSDNKPSNRLTFNDFENMDGWVSGEPNPSLTKEKAHSGVYSVKVDPSVEYSLGYGNALSRLSNSRADIAKMNLHGWAFVPNDKDFPQVVAELRDPTDGKVLLREAVDLHNEANSKGYAKWIEFNRPLALPATATAFSRLQVYLWRGNSPDPVYVDDLSLEKAPQ